MQKRFFEALKAGKPIRPLKLLKLLLPSLKLSLVNLVIQNIKHNI
jgi:hypothetical protein